MGDENIFDNFKKLLSSNLIKFLLFIYKNNTLHDTYKLFTKNLLDIPLTSEMTNIYIYTHFKITKDEIKLIESYI